MARCHSAPAIDDGVVRIVDSGLGVAVAQFGGRAKDAIRREVAGVRQVASRGDVTGTRIDGLGFSAISL